MSSCLYRYSVTDSFILTPNRYGIMKK